MKIKLSIPILIALALAACGGQPKHERTLRGSLVTLNAARDGFVVWDRGHQQELVERASSLAEGKASLAAYRAAREPVETGFAIAYRGLAMAALDPTQLNVSRVLEHVRDVLATIKTLTGMSPNDLPQGP